jgi:general secretion pathway protein D
LNTLSQPLPFHTRPIGGTNFAQRPQVVGGQAEGLVGGIFRGSIVGPTIQALAKSADVNVVSSPQVLAEENQEAEIFVGDLIPVITSQVTTSIEVGVGTPGVIQSVEYRNVGVRLKMKPQINDDGFITMEIQVQVEGIREAAVPQSALRLPAFTSRLVTTRSQVRDGDYVVLGGLISEQTDRTVTKAPLLGDIPGIGLLFRRQTARRDKTNLIVFLRPRIVTEPDTLLEITEEERREFREGARPTGRPDPNALDRIIPEN